MSVVSDPLHQSELLLSLLRSSEAGPVELSFDPGVVSHGIASRTPHVFDSGSRFLIVPSPLTALLDADSEVLSQLRQRPVAAEAMVAEAAMSSLVGARMTPEADGIVYWLDGAYPSLTTPMEYGGHFLEVDRALLNDLARLAPVLLFAEGAADPYLDFLADLPAAAFGWRSAAASVAEVRASRGGALATDAPGADILLVGLPSLVVR